jgi:methylated-DNA-[protein]-cysteine S-methyltransferase
MLKAVKTCPPMAEMQKTMKYTIFKTKWGYFGLASTDNGLLRTCLPLAKREKAKSQLLQNLPDPQYDKALFKTIQKQVIAYFEGDCVDFRDIPVALACPERPVVSTVEPSRRDGLGLFARRVLTACRKIEFGQTVSYGRLAEMAGKSGAARAVGNALARNPLPLIIPCHRVVCANGSLGGFSASGGVNLKKRMLKLEAE